MKNTVTGLGQIKNGDFVVVRCDSEPKDALGVVVGDTVVYQNGDYEYINDLSHDLGTPATDWEIEYYVVAVIRTESFGKARKAWKMGRVDDFCYLSPEVRRELTAIARVREMLKNEIAALDELGIPIE